MVTSNVTGDHDLCDPQPQPGVLSDHFSSAYAETCARQVDANGSRLRVSLRGEAKSAAEVLEGARALKIA
jgi:hypothetical protein